MTQKVGFWSSWIRPVTPAIKRWMVFYVSVDNGPKSSRVVGLYNTKAEAEQIAFQSNARHDGPFDQYGVFDLLAPAG